MPNRFSVLHRFSWRLLIGWCAILICVGAQAAGALTTPRIAMHHSSWLPKDGAPPFVTALAQTKDGWLWVGSSVGLYRFDGVRFELFTPRNAPMPSTYIRSLKALPSGSLWVGYHYGGASEIRDERVLRHFPAKKGGLQGSLYDFAVDAEGRMWAAGIVGLYQLKHGEFEPAAAETAAPKSAIQLLPDSVGGLWVRSTQGVYYRAPGQQVFAPQPGVWAWGSMVEAADGSILASDTEQGGLRMLRGPLDGKPALQWPVRAGANNSLAFDRAGRLWIAREDGVEMLRPGVSPDLSQTLGLPQGLSGGAATALLVDREGNIWVGTDAGLDRFRENKLTHYPAAPSQGEALPLAVGLQGEVWTNQQLILDPRKAALVFDPSPASATNFSLVQFVDPHGRLWTHSLDGLSHIERNSDGFKRTFIPPPPKAYRAQAHCLGMDPQGGLWADFGPAIYRYADGAWLRNGGYDALGRRGCTTLYTDPADGTLWFGGTNNALLALRAGKVHEYGQADGIDLGVPTQLYRAGDTLWVGGENGVAFFDGQRFHRVHGMGGELFQSTAGMARSDDGDLWLNSARGIFRIALRDQLRLRQQPSYLVPFSRLGYEDGLQGAAAQIGGIRSVVAAAGKMWFSTTSGLFWLDPGNLLHNRLPPPITIQRLRAGERNYLPIAGLSLPEGSQQLSIDYTALSLTMPERMQFRYRLDGFEQDWQQAGSRRTAYYTNLSPGEYRFQVQASNNDGVWNTTGASLTFHIRPTLLQTWWCRSLLVLLALIGMWWLHRLRLIQAAARVREKLAERLDERERIARELHDTLLQSVQGLTLVFRAVSKRLSAPDERAAIEKALQLAGGVIEEGRDRVQGLRQSDYPGGLFEVLHQHGSLLAEAHEVTFHASILGEPCQLQTIVSEEFRAIGKEALANAFHHASASRIELLVQYGASELRLCIRDNGVGIPADVLAKGGINGHWGLTGMRERAARIKARLSCQSGNDVGTCWQLSIPALLAYEGGRRWRWPGS